MAGELARSGRASTGWPSCPPRRSGLSASRQMSDKDPTPRGAEPAEAGAACARAAVPPRRHARFFVLERARGGRRAAARRRSVAADTHPLSTDLVRVLGDDNRAVGPWDPKLDPDTLRKMLRDMITVRIFDDRMYRSQRQGKTSFYMKCTGEEAIAVAAADRDAPRRHALPDLSPAGPAGRARLSADRHDVPDLFEQRRQVEGPPAADHVFGQGARLLLDLRQPRHAIPQAVGWSMASAIKGDSRIAMGWIGDGATAEGDFHSRLRSRRSKCAGDPPAGNNPWAISSFSGIAGAERATFAQRAVGYGIAGLSRRRQ